jgi:hypothetical protein
MILNIFGVEDRGKGQSKLSAQDQAILDELLASQADEDGEGDPAPENAGDGGRLLPAPDAPPVDNGNEDDDNA